MQIIFWIEKEVLIRGSIVTFVFPNKIGFGLLPFYLKFEIRVFAARTFLCVLIL